MLPGPRDGGGRRLPYTRAGNGFALAMLEWCGWQLGDTWLHGAAAPGAALGVQSAFHPLSKCGAPRCYPAAPSNLNAATCSAWYQPAAVAAALLYNFPHILDECPARSRSRIDGLQIRTPKGPLVWAERSASGRAVKPCARRQAVCASITGHAVSCTGSGGTDPAAAHSRPGRSGHSTALAKSSPLLRRRPQLQACALMCLPPSGPCGRHTVCHTGAMWHCKARQAAARPPLLPACSPPWARLLARESGKGNSTYVSAPPCTATS